MLEIIGDRGSGKTTALISTFLADESKDKALVVVHSSAISHYQSKWPALKKCRIAPLSALETDSLRGIGRLYVDEIQMPKPGPWLERVVVATRAR